jgi:hypothetical protein
VPGAALALDLGNQGPAGPREPPDLGVLALVTTQCHFHGLFFLYILFNTQVEVMITLTR